MHDDEGGRPEVQEHIKRLKADLPVVEALAAGDRPGPPGGGA